MQGHSWPKNQNAHYWKGVLGVPSSAGVKGAPWEGVKGAKPAAENGFSGYGRGKHELSKHDIYVMQS